MNKMNKCHKASPEEMNRNEVSVVSTIITVQHSQ